MVCLFWGINLACKWKTNCAPQNILSISILILSVTFFILANVFAEIDDYVFYNKLDIIDGFATLLIYPLSYFYFKSLTDEHSFRWRDYIWILPSLLVGGGTAISSALIGDEKIVIYLPEIINQETLPPAYATPLYQFHYFVSIQLYNFFRLTGAILISIYAIISIIRYRQRLNEFYSNLEEKSMKNNYGVLICFLISLLFSLLLPLKGRLFFSQNPTLLVPLLIGWASVLYYMCYHASLLKYTADGLAADIAQVDQETIAQGYESPEDVDIVDAKNDTDTDTASIKKKINPKLVDQFNHLIDTENIYLQSDLRLDDVVRLMRTNRTYISRLINEEYHHSFSDFINGKRVAHAQQLMLSDKNITQETVASLSGFSHVSSFSRTFKQQTKMTPGEWLRCNL